MSYTRFVIISHLRSGTHLLRTMLESHLEIVCQTEVFNSDNQNLPYALSTPTSEVLDRWVFRDFPEPITCTGFVLQAYHPGGLKAFPGIRENPHWADIWPRLQNMSGLRVIHLRRDNLLRRYLSHMMARATGNWHHWDRDRVSTVSHIEKPSIQGRDANNRPPIKIDAENLKLDFEEVEELHQQVEQRFGQQFGQGAYLPLSYEQLCSEPTRMAGQLLQFLGVAVAPLQAAVNKIEDRQLEASIENYAELKQAFVNTRWQAFF